MKYRVTVTDKIGSPHTTVGEFEAVSGHDAIRQAQQSFTPDYKKPSWFATPCYEVGQVFYKWWDGK